MRQATNLQSRPLRDGVIVHSISWVGEDQLDEHLGRVACPDRLCGFQQTKQFGALRRTPLRDD